MIKVKILWNINCIWMRRKKNRWLQVVILNDLFGIKLIFYDLSWMVLGTFTRTTSQMCNFPSGNFPKVRLGPLRSRRLQLGPSDAARGPSTTARTDLGVAIWDNTLGKLPLSEFVWTPYSLVFVVFNDFLLIDATDRSKISCNHHQIFFDVSLYPL